MKNKDFQAESSDKKLKKVRVRGVGSYDPETQKFGFEPFNEAPSTQTNVKTCSGGGKRWVTTGVDPSRMITLKVKESSSDQYAELAKQFHLLTKDMKPKQPIELPTEQRVVDEDGLQCWLNVEKGQLTYTGTFNLSKHCRDWQAEVLRQVQLIVRRLPASEKFNKVISYIKYGGNKQ